jgi:hypothetical protein
MSQHVTKNNQPMVPFLLFILLVNEVARASYGHSLILELDLEDVGFHATTQDYPHLGLQH